MSYSSDWHTYQASVHYGRGDPSFYGLLMAAMRRADSTNAAKLRRAFPEVWDDLQARYEAPAGILPSDPATLRARVLGELPT